MEADGMVIVDCEFDKTTEMFTITLRGEVHPPYTTGLVTEQVCRATLRSLQMSWLGSKTPNTLEKDPSEPDKLMRQAIDRAYGKPD